MRTAEEYRAARAVASHWLQMRIENVRTPARLPGICVVRVEITRSFRGAPPAARRIELEVECKSRAERSPPGDEFRVDAEELLPGRHLEAFVMAEAGRYSVAARQIEIVAQPREVPSFGGKE